MILLWKTNFCLSIAMLSLLDSAKKSFSLIWNVMISQLVRFFVLKFGLQVQSHPVILQIFTVTVEKVHCNPLHTLPKVGKLVFRLWNFLCKIISKLITYLPNFEAKWFTQKKIFKVYQHVENFTIAKLCHPSKDWKLSFLPWNSFHENHTYVDKMCAKFQIQKIHPQNNTSNLPMVQYSAYSTLVGLESEKMA